MKTLLFSLFIPVALLSAGSTKPINKEKCSCENIPLYGKVKVVNSYADFEVKIVDSYADLEVKLIESYASSCGEWIFVEQYPDFTIKFVEQYPDFTIKFVESYPGVK